LVKKREGILEVKNDVSNPSVEDFATQLQIFHGEITSYLEKSLKIL
jgi:hypothetical protein